MKKWHLVSLVLALVMAFTLVGPAFAYKPPPPKGGCEADAEAGAGVSVSPISGATIVDVDEAVPQTYSATVSYVVYAGADSEAWAKKGGQVVAVALTATDAGGNLVLAGPAGVLDSDSFAVGDFDFDSDWGKKYAEADASAYLEGSVTLQVTLPVGFDTGEIYGVDAQAFARAFAAAWSEWCVKRGGGWCMDIDWAKAFDLESLAIRIVNRPNMRFDFYVDPGCVVEITPYADWANGRLGARTFTQKAYIQDDPYAPGGKKYEPASFNLPGGVVYETKVWCPDGRDIITKADFHVGYIFSGYQKIWPPFHNAPPSGPGAFIGFHVTGGVK